MLHVQSISDWAPSCIGPYSQAVTLSPPGLALFAGQIGLDPGSMQLLPPARQAARCLASCQAVAVAARCNLPAGLLGCTVYAAGSGGASGEAACEARGGQQHAAEGGYSTEHAALAQAAELLDGMLAEGSAVQQEASASEGACPDVESEDDDVFMDDYLRPPAMAERHWAPLLTYVIVPGLPKGAVVEVQPVACSAAGLETGMRPAWADALSNATCSHPIGLATPEGCSVLSSSLSSLRHACLLQLSVPCAAFVECQDDSVVAAAGAALQEAASAGLAASQLCMQDVLCLRAYFCAGLLTEPQARTMLGEAFGEACRAALVCVPVIAVGPTPAADAALHVALIALICKSP